MLTNKMLVYKYRAGSEETFRRDLFALEKNFFWGANLKTLNDPCEALLTLDKFEKQRDSLQWLFGEKFKENFVPVEKALNGFISLKEKIGVFSLSKRYDDELLWAHYSNSHKGFCIEYDLNLLKNGYKKNKTYSFPIKYSNTPPEVDLLKDIASIKSEKLIQKLLGFKSKRWSYEEEYRIITDFFGEFFYHPSALKSIYFGVRMPDTLKDEMVNRLKGRQIKYYQLTQQRNSYRFNRKLIEDVSNSEVSFMKQYTFSDRDKTKTVNIELIERDYYEIIKRGDVVIKLDMTIPKKQILELSKYLHENLFFKAERVLIQIYQKKQKNQGVTWATANLADKKWNININEFVFQDI
ncbi:DUF2971 domain-containing protein [Sinomicrobium kalidii]|uniref:DUF2971 domain-containing protein n=1 Tax=Sinomicrobium kalidii TaxID=2900738 RepID=UPI001E46A4D5|nr:DUF2971 domain-containing protein [Sinomicrobium kalidii]UGU14245.1 DUF2971 domain-containing protein [Sinomicrobium kalidii]